MTFAAAVLALSSISDSWVGEIRSGDVLRLAETLHVTPVHASSTCPALQGHHLSLLGRHPSRGALVLYHALDTAKQLPKDSRRCRDRSMFYLTETILAAQPIVARAAGFGGPASSPVLPG
jgi:hypothetical protein